MINIFIVDDNIITLELYKELFGLIGFNVIDIAKNGEEAVAKFQKFIIKPDLIIMDYHMPRKNGIEATQAILEIDNSAKVIIVSGDSSIKEKALATGAICFNKKPLNISELEKQMHLLIKRDLAGSD